MVKWNPLDSLVLCFCYLFWTWPCTTFNSIPISLNLLSNRKMALIYSVTISEHDSNSIIFMLHLNCKYHPWGLINDMQMSIYNSIIFIPGYCYSWHYNKVWGINLTFPMLPNHTPLFKNPITTTALLETNPSSQSLSQPSKTNENTSTSYVTFISLLLPT